MKKFDVYSHPTHGFVAVKNGFSWPGLFFTWIWMLFCRMWLASGVVIAISWGLWLVMNLIPVSDDVEDFTGELAILAVFGLGLVVNLVVGKMGNAWRRSSLGKRGFAHVKSVQAGSVDAAIAKIAAGQEEAEVD